MAVAVYGPPIPARPSSFVGTVALRVPTGSPDAVRLEHRVAGADANPYLLLAAVLAGVHHGLTNKVEPGAPIEGNSYEQMEPSLPNNLRDALRELDESEIMAKYIDPKYIDILPCIAPAGRRSSRVFRVSCSAPQAICAAASYSAGLAALTVRQVL